MKTREELQNYVTKFIPQLAEESGETPILYPIDNGSLDKLHQYSEAKIVWNPFQLDSLIREAYGNLTVCLDLRASGQNLEIQAVNEILNHVRISKELEIQKKLFEYEDFENYDFFSSKIAAQTELNSNNDKISPSTESLNKAKDYNKKIRGFDKEKLDAFKNYIETIKYQQGINGSALNLKQRFNQVKDVFDIKLLELFYILLSIRTGIELVYPDSKKELEDTTFPELTNTGYLLKVQKYLINLIDKIERIKQYEQDFTISGFIKKGFLVNKDWQIGDNENVLEDLLKDGSSEFSIPSDFLKDYKNLRLQGIDIYMVHPNEQGFNSVPMAITPPKITDSADNQVWEMQKKSVLAYHSLAKSVSDTYYSDQLLTNRSLKGDWLIELPVGSIGLTGITDIRIDFHVTARIL
nr:hypothetical protein [uncultured Allomuricauda sp.]